MTMEEGLYKISNDSNRPVKSLLRSLLKIAKARRDSLREEYYDCLKESCTMPGYLVEAERVDKIISKGKKLLKNLPD